MRSSKLVSAAAATATLLALAPAGAAARPNGLPQKASKGPCRVHLTAPPPAIAAGEAVTIGGQVTCATGESPSGRQVALYRRAANRAGFALVGMATTEGTGAFSVAPPAFEVNSVFFAVSQGAKSAHQTIRIAPVVTPTTPSTPAEGAQLLTGGSSGPARNTVTFTGKVSPVAAGDLVALQRENATANEEWHRIGLPSTVNKNGEYSITHTFGVPGDASIRVVVHPRNNLSVSAASTPASYEISQAENPLFTIKSEADPLTWGGSVELNGVVKGAAAKTPLTLLMHTRGSSSFAPVATAQTGEGGTYKFTQAPRQGTFYKVTDATASSAVLFEGVKYGLTVSPPPSSVPATQPVTFSGTVIPAVAKHKVYLERQGSLKLGWHVIDIGEVVAPANPSGEPGTFSFQHAFSSPTPSTAPARLRIKVPGDPGNQGVASAPFELTVTPTPASLLKPEAPGNSKLPSEGQL